jgi:hypothetical protein
LESIKRKILEALWGVLVEVSGKSAEIFWFGQGFSEISLIYFHRKYKNFNLILWFPLVFTLHPPYI